MFTGEQIRQKRERDGLSAEELADLLGVKKANLYKWEKGHRPHNPKDYIVIEKWLASEMESVPKEARPVAQNDKSQTGLSWEEYAKILEADKAWFKQAMDSSLAAILKGVGELAEGQKDLLAYQQGWLNHLEGSAQLVAKVQGQKKGSGVSKKDGKKTGTHVP